ncbi:hypothetical protein ARMSODRAFT_900707, partial [Armillaria solidipes]
MTPHRHWFNVYSPHVVPIRLADNTVIYSEGIGTVVLEPEVEGEKSTVVELLDTLHVPALRNNLLSPYHLTREKGFKISITGSDVTFRQDDKVQFTATVNDNNIGYVNATTRSFSESANSSSTSTCPMDDTLWHKQCCHRNIDTIRRMHAKQLVMGMKREPGRPTDPI